MNEELRAITKNQRSFDSAVMMSSLMPSEKYSCSGSSLMLTKGSTAIDGPARQRRDGRLASTGGAAAAPLVLHVADETETLARDGADQCLVLAAVADGLARGVNAAGEGRFRDDAAMPDRRNQIVLADHAVAVLDQKDQEIEHLRLERNQFPGVLELTRVRVELIFFKAIEQLVLRPLRAS